MLVIGRKAGESLLLGNDIKISILSIVGDKVTIGIDAPKHIQIIREELADIIEANRDATCHKGNDDYMRIALLLKKNKYNLKK
ncbi:MAG: carbon storage regulator [Anaerovoracaceae bacterium]